VAIIAGAGVVIAWLHGVAIRLHRKRRLLVAAHALAAVVGVIAACYIAVHRTRLLDMIVSTVRFGPDV
jgi:ABC-type dipeptide/oligopeptide/nickel transport system permease component